MEQARVQLNLPNKMQITSHTFSLFHKHLHMILSDNAMNALVADLILALFKEQIHSFIPRHNFHQTDCFANKKRCINILYAGSRAAEKQLEI